ncbi:hypothetical protein HD806DRAFT_487341 [Xylariaceae sp. AK1471]|nr:hypothetical protein HD806DRAFT_487341 [Xylariaceae sp. AK1471]
MFPLQVVYTMSERKNHYNHRVSILASSQAEAIQLLQRQVEALVSFVPFTDWQIPMAYAFTGQGTIFISIDKSLYQDSPLFRRQINHLDSFGQRQGVSSFLLIIIGICLIEEVSIVAIHPTIVCVEISLARLWQTLGIEPDVLIGHNLV